MLFSMLFYFFFYFHTFSFFTSFILFFFYLLFLSPFPPSPTPYSPLHIVIACNTGPNNASQHGTNLLHRRRCPHSQSSSSSSTRQSAVRPDCSPACLAVQGWFCVHACDDHDTQIGRSGRSVPGRSHLKEGSCARRFKFRHPIQHQPNRASSTTSKPRFSLSLLLSFPLSLSPFLYTRNIRCHPPPPQ